MHTCVSPAGTPCLSQKSHNRPVFTAPACGILSPHQCSSVPRGDRLQHPFRQACRSQRHSNVSRLRAQTDQQESQAVTRRVALPAAASVVIAAAGFVFVRNIFSDLAGPEGKKATLAALSAEEETREGKVSSLHQASWCILHVWAQPQCYRNVNCENGTCACPSHFHGQQNLCLEAYLQPPQQAKDRKHIMVHPSSGGCV